VAHSSQAKPIQPRFAAFQSDGGGADFGLLADPPNIFCGVPRVIRRYPHLVGTTCVYSQKQGLEATTKMQVAPLYCFLRRDDDADDLCGYQPELNFVNARSLVSFGR